MCERDDGVFLHYWIYMYIFVGAKIQPILGYIKALPLYRALWGGGRVKAELRDYATICKIIVVNNLY